MNVPPENYAPYLLHHLDRLRAEGTFCNVKVVSGDGAEFMAHRAVLAAVSPFFANIFAQPTNTGPLTVVHLKNTDSKSVQAVVDYVYSGFIDFHGLPDLKTIKNIATRCQIEPLCAILSTIGDGIGDKMKKSIRSGLSSLHSAISCSPCSENKENIGKQKQCRGVSADMTQLQNVPPVPSCTFDSAFSFGFSNNVPSTSALRSVSALPPVTSTPKTYFDPESTLKPFSCKFCGRTYSDSRRLMRHSDRIHGYNPFKKFSRSPCNLNSFNFNNLSTIGSIDTTASTRLSDLSYYRRLRKKQSRKLTRSGRKDRSRRYSKRVSHQSTLLNDSNGSRKRSQGQLRSQPKRIRRVESKVTEVKITEVQKGSSSEFIGSEGLKSDLIGSEDFRSDLIGSENFTDHVPSSLEKSPRGVNVKEALFTAPELPPRRRKSKPGKIREPGDGRSLAAVRSREPTPFMMRGSMGIKNLSIGTSDGTLCRSAVENEVTPGAKVLPKREIISGQKPRKESTLLSRSSSLDSFKTSSTSGQISGSGADFPELGTGTKRNENGTLQDERDFPARDRIRVEPAPPAPPPSETESVATHSDLLTTTTEYFTAPLDQQVMVDYGTL